MRGSPSCLQSTSSRRYAALSLALFLDGRPFAVHTLLPFLSPLSGPLLLPICGAHTYTLLSFPASCSPTAVTVLLPLLLRQVWEAVLPELAVLHLSATVDTRQYSPPPRSAPTVPPAATLPVLPAPSAASSTGEQEGEGKEAGEGEEGIPLVKAGEMAAGSALPGPLLEGEEKEEEEALMSIVAAALPLTIT